MLSESVHRSHLPRTTLTCREGDWLPGAVTDKGQLLWTQAWTTFPLSSATHQLHSSILNLKSLSFLICRKGRYTAP